MQATTKDILDLLESFASFSISEDWDNSGLQAGNLLWPVKKILIALDVSMEVMHKAKEYGSDLVLTHHPLIIKPIKIVDFNSMPGSAISISALNKISIVCAHTNFDKAFASI